MNVTAIVYTSNTGYTAQYAHLLGTQTGLPVYALSEAREKLEAGSGILYLGWLMAGRVQGYQKAAKRYQVRAVCGVGMGATGSQLEDLRKANGFQDGFQVFTLQGGFDLSKLRGVYKLMMTIMAKTVGEKLKKQANRTREEEAMWKLLTQGGSCVSLENLRAVLEWCGTGGG